MTLFQNVSRRLVVAQIHGVMAAATMLLGLQFSPLESSRYASVGEAMDLPACVAPAGFSTLIPSPSFEHDQTLFWLDMGADILWRSSDDGASWQEIFRAPGNYGHLEDLSFPPPSSGMRHGGYLRYTLRAAPFTYEFLSRTLDLGAAWQERVSCGSHCVELVPTSQPDIVFAGRIPLLGQPNPTDILRSIDGGLTWATVFTDTAGTVTVSPDFDDDKTVFMQLHSPPATVGSPFLVSFDAGESWQERSGYCGPFGGALALSSNYGIDHTLVASEEGSIFKSQDAGLTWVHIYPRGAPACNPPPQLRVSFVRLSPHYGSDDTLFAVSELNSVQTLYGSGDDGRSWSVRAQARAIHDLRVVARAQRTRQSTRIAGFASARFDVRDASDRLYLPLIRAADSQPPTSFPLTLFLRAALPPNILDVYQYRSDDGGLTWECMTPPWEASGAPPAASFSNSLPSADGYFVALPSPHYEQDHTLFLVNRTHSRVWRSRDDGATWSEIYRFSSRWGFDRLFDFAVTPIHNEPGFRLHLRRQDDLSGMASLGSSDGGDTWHEITTPCSDYECLEDSLRPTDDPAVLFQPRIHSPYIGSPPPGVFRSQDSGASWQMAWGPASVYQVEPSPAFAADRTVFATPAGRDVAPNAYLIVSKDGGVTWQPLGAGLCDEPIDHLAVSPDFVQDHTLWAVQDGTVSKSQDGGATWRRIAWPGEGPCAGWRFARLYPSPRYRTDHTIFLSAEALYSSDDNGATWRMARDGYLNQVSIQPVAASLAASIRLVEPERQVYFPLVMGSAAAPAPRPLALFVSAGTPYRSTDGGVSWYAIP